jgi:hypothetical protein
MNSGWIVPVILSAVGFIIQGVFCKSEKEI